MPYGATTTGLKDFFQQFKSATNHNALKSGNLRCLEVAWLISKILKIYIFFPFAIGANSKEILLVAKEILLVAKPKVKKIKTKNVEWRFF